MAADPKPNPGVETLQRVRRIETRITQTMIALGIPTDAQKPIFNEGSLILPSIHCSMKEIVDSIPGNWHGPVGVFVGTGRVATIGR